VPAARSDEHEVTVRTGSGYRPSDN
jgi:hypothetical protein